MAKRKEEMPVGEEEEMDARERGRDDGWMIERERKR